MRKLRSTCLGSRPARPYGRATTGRSASPSATAADRGSTSTRASTKTGMTRRFSFEPALLPLLVRMHEEARGRGRVVPRMPAVEDLAKTFRDHLQLAGIKRHELYISDRTRKNITFYDLCATGMTWMARR